MIIGLYALTEVNYFSYKQVAESKDVNASVVVIPAIGVFEKINNVSISQGVYIDETSNIPTKGDTVLYGHRCSRTCNWALYFLYNVSKTSKQ